MGCFVCSFVCAFSIRSDIHSFKLLAELLKAHPNHFQCLITTRPISSHLKLEFANLLRLYESMSISLGPMTKAEMSDLAALKLGVQNVSGRLNELIYQKSKGQTSSVFF